MKKNVWNLYAPIYEFFMKSDQKVFPSMYARIEEIIRGKTVLEIATGPGVLAKRVAAAAQKMIATDYAEGMIRAAKKGEYPENLTFEVADATNLPYDDRSFDVVLIANALHVMPEPEKALAEIDRVLREGGILIAPNFIQAGKSMKGSLWSSILKAAGIKFQNQWTKEAYESFLERNGWRVIRSEATPGRITILYTECVREKSEG